MTINLNTGSVQVPRKPHLGLGVAKAVGALTEYNDTTPAETVVYPSEHRQLLIVEPMTMLVVTGYNLDDITSVIFRKVLRSHGVPVQGTAGCCPTMTISHSIRLHSTELPCWKLNRCLPVFVVKTPGCYEIDVTGDNANVVVTAMAFPMQEVNDFSPCDCQTLTPEEPVPTEPIPE